MDNQTKIKILKIIAMGLVYGFAAGIASKIWKL